MRLFPLSRKFFRIGNGTNFLFALTKINSFRSIIFVKKKKKIKLIHQHEKFARLQRVINTSPLIGIKKGNENIVNGIAIFGKIWMK